MGGRRGRSGESAPRLDLAGGQPARGARIRARARLDGGAARAGGAGTGSAPEGPSAAWPRLLGAPGGREPLPAAESHAADDDRDRVCPLRGRDGARGPAQRPRPDGRRRQPGSAELRALRRTAGPGSRRQGAPRRARGRADGPGTAGRRASRGHPGDSPRDLPRGRRALSRASLGTSARVPTDLRGRAPGASRAWTSRRPWRTSVRSTGGAWRRTSSSCSRRRPSRRRPRARSCSRISPRKRRGRRCSGIWSGAFRTCPPSTRR